MTTMETRPVDRAAGPSLLRIIWHWPRVRRDRLGELVELARRYGDFVKLPFPIPTFVLNHPDDVKHVLVTNGVNYRKTGALIKGRRLLGNGLLSSEGKSHRFHRRLLQPLFQPRNVEKFAPIVTATTVDVVDGWADGAIVDMSVEMTRLTLSIVSKSFLGMDLAPEARLINDSLTTAQRHVCFLANHVVPPRDWMIPRRARAFDRAIRALDACVWRVINEHRRRDGGPEDMVSVLLGADQEDGATMSDEQVRDEVMTVLLAGHETTSNALSWVAYLLTLHPEVEERLHDEVDTVLGGRPPQMADIPRLRYTDWVFSETMRLYPPVWMIGRRSLAPDTLPVGGPIPDDAQFGISPWVLHRHPRYFPDPERFDPERFSPEVARSRPVHAYVPFGAGERACIGQAFARMEAVLILAALAQRCRLTLEPGQRIEPEPLLTLRPRWGMRMRVARR